MKNRKMIFGIIAVVAILFMLAACGGGKPNGAYVDLEGNSFTFSGNRFSLDQYGEKVEGTYKIKDGKITFVSSGDDQKEFEYSLEGNTLTLDGDVFTKKTASKSGNTKEKSSGKGSAFPGKWSLVEGPRRNNPEEMDLLKDGTGIVDGVGIQWKVENGRFYLIHPLVSFSSTYKVSGSTLTLTNDDDEVLIYRKN